MNPFDHPELNSRYFFPRRSPLARPFIVKGADFELHCHKGEACGSDALTLVHFHGNGEVVADYLPEFEHWTTVLGVNLFLAEYRGYGGSTGQPTLAAMQEDTALIFEALALPAEKLVVFGRSVGSIYAIEFARRYPQVAGLIIESGIASPLERALMRVSPEQIGTDAGGLRELAGSFFNHEKVMSSYTGHLLIMHTKNDSIVAVDSAKRLYSWSERENAKCLLFDRGDHNDIFHVNKTGYTNAVAELIQSANAGTFPR